jgi:hypothetical protein
VSVGAGLLTLLLLVVVIMLVSGPLRAHQRGGRRDREGNAGTASPAPDGEGSGAPSLARDRAALEASREAKYRDLRDTELDYRTGKLSESDYQAIRARLRLEALEILNRLEAAGEADAGRKGAERAVENAKDAPGVAASDLQERDRVGEEEHGEPDRPAVEVALDHRAAPEGPGAAAHAERAREARVLAGVHQHEQDEDHRDEDL